METLKFVIVSPRQKYGGAIALHALCKYINDIGYKAYIYYIGEYDFYENQGVRQIIKQVLFQISDVRKKMFVKLIKEESLVNNGSYTGYINEPVKGCSRKIFPCVDKNTIVVYPDVVYGNFLHAKNVVRWLLYYNRYDEKAYGKNDIFFAYRDIFNDNKFNPQNRILNIAWFDLNLYKQTNFEKRSGTCYIVRKGANRDDLPKKFDGVIIDSLSEKKKVEILNNCEYCISYDTQTAYSTIAAICGCKSIVIPEYGKSYSDYRENDEERYGVAFGMSDEQLAWADSTQKKARERYVKLNEKGKAETKKFVEICKNYFI